MTYTIVLKDQDQSWDPDTAREQSTVSYQWKDLAAHRQDTVGTSAKGLLSLCKFDDLEATYRGKGAPSARPIDLSNVRQISVMVRR